MFGFSGSYACGSALLTASLGTVLKARDIHDREVLRQGFRNQDRLRRPSSDRARGPIEHCLWFLAAQVTELQLYKHIAAYRVTAPGYLSSMFHGGAAPDVTEAKAARKSSYAEYKLNPVGNFIDDDLDRTPADPQGSRRSLSSYESSCHILDLAGSHPYIAQASSQGRRRSLS